MRCSKIRPEARQISPPARRAASLQESLDKMQDELGPERVERELARGRAMDIEDAIQLAEAATASLA
jgi:hypothetical protein